MTHTLTIERITRTYDRLPVRTPGDVATLLAGGCGCEEGNLTTSPLGFAVAAPAAPLSSITWSGTIGTEGELTGDGRLIEPNALRWENLPIPLRYAASDVGGHDGAVVVGRIMTIKRGPKGALLATGDFDTDSIDGMEAARQVDKGLTNGVSMDLDSVSFEVRVAKELLEGDLMMMPMLAVEDDTAPPEPEVDADGRVKVMEINADDEVMVTTDARIRAATMVAIPAFAGATIGLDNPLSADGEQAAAASTATLGGIMPDGETECSCTEGDTDYDPECECEQAAPPVLALVAGAYPIEPPAEWFNDPHLSEPTPLVITDEGRVFGHLAIWGTCHTAYTGQCVEPPHSASGYAHFHLGSVLTAEGAEVATGVLTVDTLHADRSLSATATIAHYEHTGRAAADVRAGEDEFGIWITGALRPNATPEQVRTLRASPASGDWRRRGGNLELVAALGVNVPGFPVPRPQGLVASGVMMSLVASGMLAPHKVIPPGAPGALSPDDIRYLKRLAARERRAEAEEVLGIQSSADALAARVRSLRVHAMARRLALR